MKKSRIMRITAMFMALVLVFCLAGCSGGTSGGSSSTGETSTAKESSTAPETSTDTEPEDAGTEEGGSTTKRPYPLESDELGLQPYDEMITITTARATNATDTDAFEPGDDFAHNHWYNAYRDDLNIDVVNEYEIPGTEYESRINMLMASDTLPDFFQCTPLQFMQLVEAGQVQSMTEAYNTYGTDAYKAEMEAMDAIMQSVTVDGEIMGLPHTRIVPICMMWTRGDWREKVGIEKEELSTFDGWVKLAKAYIEQDPDGNGEDDTFGFTGPVFGTNADHEMGLKWIFNAHHAYPRIWIEKDGEVVYGSVLPEVKTALAKMAELYQEGIIDPAYASKTGGTPDELVASHQTGIWDNHQWSAASFPGLSQREPNAFMEYYEYPSVDGEQALGSVRVPITGIYAVSKNCEHPDAVVKLANYFVEKTWNLKDETEMDYFIEETIDGQRKYYRGLVALDPSLPLEHYKVGQECAAYWDGEIALDDALVYTQSSIAAATDPTNIALVPLFGDDGCITRLMIDMMDTKRYMPDQYNQAPTETMVSKWALLQDKEEEVFNRIVMGEDSIDAFDTFVAEWYAQGGEQITAEMNERFQ